MLNAKSMDPNTLDSTMTVLLKHEHDIVRARRAFAAEQRVLEESERLENQPKMEDPSSGPVRDPFPREVRRRRKPGDAGTRGR